MSAMDTSSLEEVIAKAQVPFEEGGRLRPWEKIVLVGKITGDELLQNNLFFGLLLWSLSVVVVHHPLARAESAFANRGGVAWILSHPVEQISPLREARGLAPVDRDFLEACGHWLGSEECQAVQQFFRLA